MAGSSRTALSTRSDQATIPALLGPVRILTAEAAAEAWRLVEVVSQERSAGRVFLSWSGGDGAPRDATFDFNGAARVCVCARSVAVRVQSRDPAATQTVVVTVTDTDSAVVFHNVFDDHQLASVAGITYEIPAWASKVEVQVSDRTLLGTIVVELLNVAGTGIAQFLVSEQPAGGVAVGACRSVKLSGVIGAARLVYTLCL